MSKEYDLEKRTTHFGEAIVVFCKNIKLDDINSSIIKQLIRSGTSIGANYCEANNACSKKDFQNKIFICKKESQETKYWLQILNKSNPEKRENLKKLWRECQELTMIFQKIINSCRNKNN